MVPQLTKRKSQVKFLPLNLPVEAVGILFPIMILNCNFYECVKFVAILPERSVSQEKCLKKITILFAWVIQQLTVLECKYGLVLSNTLDVPATGTKCTPFLH